MAGRLFPVVVAAVALPAAVAAQSLSYSGSIQYSTGSYIFTEPMRTVSLYNTLTLARGRFRLTAGAPLILHNSGAVTLVGGAYLPTGGLDNGAVGGRQQGQSVPMGPGGRNRSLVTPAAVAAALVDPAAVGSGGVALTDSRLGSQVVESGDSIVAAPGDYELAVGDPLVTGGVQLFRGRGTLRSVDLTAAAKAPVNGLESGVGTGEWDWSVGGTTALAIGPVVAVLDGAYWWYGDLPELALNDGFSWGVGLGLPVSRGLWLSGSTTGTNSIIGSAQPARTVSGTLLYATSPAGGVSVTLGAGLTETAADYSISIGWRHTLLR